MLGFELRVRNFTPEGPTLNDEPTFPVAGWEISTVPAYEALIIRLSFLSHPLQRVEEADPGRRYILTTKQATELRGMLDRAIQKLQSAAAPPAGVPKN